MGIFVKEINVKNLGPIEQFSMRPGKLNLVYGRNEEGKTALVEFIIRCLFKHANKWHLRGLSGKGRVTVAGVENEPIDFSPASPLKLEDYWEEQNAGLPADFSKLLVVKGAEVEIAEVDGGIDRNVISRLLSGKNVLDQVQSRISKTIQESKIENGSIIGPKRGDILARINLSEQLHRIGGLFEAIDQGYSGSRGKILLKQKQQLEENVEQMLRAKKHLAFSIDQEVTRLREKRNRISFGKIQTARDNLTVYRQKEFEFKRKQQQQISAELQSKEYDWLKSAQQVYQSAMQTRTAQPKPYLLSSAILFLMATAVFIGLKLPVFAIGCLAGVLIFGLLHFKKARGFVTGISENFEIANLRETFEEKFNQKLTGLPLILERIEKLQEEYNTAKLLSQQLRDDLNELHSLKRSVSNLIYELIGERKDSKTWDEVLRLSENNIKKLDNQIHEREKRIAQLDVDRSDFEAEVPDVIYSKQKLGSLENELRATESQIQAETQKLDSLKQRVCQETGDDITTNWQEVIAHLQNRREDVLGDYKLKTAEIIGKIAVNDVIGELRINEDDKIFARLKSPEIQEPLFQLTNRYKKIDLHGDSLVLSDAYQDFHLSDLSTGAQEQVLLGLRIGFCTKIMNGEPSFLILDDAFQYSDWQRRKLLVNKMAELAEAGWQIIYFTMDENIRELFHERGKTFGTEYRSIQLS